MTSTATFDEQWKMISEWSLASGQLTVSLSLFHESLCLCRQIFTRETCSMYVDSAEYIASSLSSTDMINCGSWYLWAFVCIFLLMDIYGWYTYFWIAFIPTLVSELSSYACQSG